MNPKFVRQGVAVALLALAGCSKPAEAPVAKPPPPPAQVDVVPEDVRSRHFLAVSKHLELGGTLYGYADVDGDALKLAGGLHDLLQQIAKTQPMLAPYAQQDLGDIFQLIGLDDIKAVGVSSVPDGSGFFQNRTFFYTPGDRHGLLAGLGGKAAPFALVKLAPADADVYSESEVDLAVVYKTVKTVVGKVAGESSSNRLETALKKAGENAALSVLDLIYGLKGHTAFVLRLDPEKTLRVPPTPAGVTVPAFSILVGVEGVAAPVEVALGKSPAFKATTSGTRHLYELVQPVPLEGLKPVFAAEGSTLYFATSPEFLAQCLDQKTSLADTPVFRQAVAHVGAEGNAIGFVSPRFFSRVRQIEALNPGLPAETKSILHYVVNRVPAPDRALITVRTNLPDGILVRSYWNRSLKQDVAMASVYNPVTVGLIAAMAIPAFQKVRMASQEKAVMNNLRQFAAAGHQFCLEHGVQTAGYRDLVGPQKYIKAMVSVAGERYETLRFVAGQPLRVRLPDGRVVEYKP